MLQELMEEETFYMQRKHLLLRNPAHVNISAGGIAKYAKNKSEAVQLLEFLASPKVMVWQLQLLNIPLKK